MKLIFLRAMENLMLEVNVKLEMSKFCNYNGKTRDFCGFLRNFT